VKRRVAAAVFILLAMVGAGVAPASAWGYRGYLAPWGCDTAFESFSGSPHIARTSKFGGSCSDMFARVRLSNGNFGAWYIDPSDAIAQNWSPLAVGGHHKICSGCTLFST